MNIQENFLSKNIFSRPGKGLESVKGIVIHWTGNAGSSAPANRNYFEQLGRQPANAAAPCFASAHFIVGLEGEIVQCLPVDEIAYHAGAKSYKPEAVTAFGRYPNNCTLGIELCHPGADGKFTKATLDAATELCRTLCCQYNLAQKDIWTHHQITGKCCPKWFVEHPEDFQEFVSNAAPPY
jgi:N-acetylmuramoyl-L-alanine amidase